MIPIALDFIYSDICSAGQCYFDRSVRVDENESLNISEIFINDALVIENHGVINADKITVCDGCGLEIINSGSISSEFVLENGANITQVISDEAHLNKVNFGNAEFYVRVDNVENVRLSDLLNVASNAKSVDVYNSRLVWDVVDTGDSNLTFHDKVFIDIENIDLITDTPILKNLDSSVRVFVETDSDTPLMSSNTYIYEGYLYVELVRETDYTKIMNDDLGLYLNSLRDVSEADSFMYVLDSVNTIDELYQIMADSVRIAPINLMRSVRMFNAFSMNDFSSASGVYGGYIVGDEFETYGASLSVGIKDIVGIRFYSNIIDATNYDEVFSGVMFGGDVRALYENETGFIRGLAGANFTKFDIAGVFDGTKSVDNPMGFSVYGALDVGYKINFDNGLYVCPFLGGTADYVDVLDKNESEYHWRIGVDLGYSFDVLGVKYDYAVRANINTNADVFVAGRLGFVSGFDAIGGFAELGVVKNETGRGYRISAGLDFKF